MRIYNITSKSIHKQYFVAPGENIKKLETGCHKSMIVYELEENCYYWRAMS